MYSLAKTLPYTFIAIKKKINKWEKFLAEVKKKKKKSSYCLFYCLVFLYALCIEMEAFSSHAFRNTALPHLSVTKKLIHCGLISCFFVFFLNSS